MSSIFPQELIDYTVDYLHDDPTSLKSCSLVSRPFLSSTRIHLFHSITLAPTPGFYGTYTDREADNFQLRRAQMRGRCQRLYSVLLASPSITQYVRELTIVDAQRFPGTVGHMWLRDEETIPLILAMFDRVEILVLQSIAQWENHTPDLRNAIRNLLRLPSLRSLSLSRNKFPNFSGLATLLSDVCPQLNCLKMALNSIDHLVLPDELLEAPSSERARLEELCVHSDLTTTDRIIEWLLHPSSNITVDSSLRVLHLYTICQTPCVYRLLDQVGDSIEHLIVNPPFSRNLMGVPILNINRTPNLRTLRLCLPSLMNNTMSFKMKAFLSPSCIFMHLESIIIEIYTPKEGRFLKLMSVMDLGEIEHILIGGNFPTLSKVAFYFKPLQQTTVQYGPIPAHLLDTWGNQLPKLRERGSLVVQNI